MAVGLDPSPKLISQALSWGADFILVHHPLALKPVLPSRQDAYNRVLGALFRQDAWLYAAHTSLDVMPNGPVRWVADALGLINISLLEETGRRAGRWFRILGPTDLILQVASKLAGCQGIEVFPSGERALEVVSAPGLDHEVVKALQDQGNAEVQMVSQELDMPLELFGFGFVGDLPQPQPWKGFVSSLVQLLGKTPRALIGNPPLEVRRVACCPGSGASLLDRAVKAGAQVYVTGDMKYHDAQDVWERGFWVVDVGHFTLEERMMRIFAELLRERLGQQGVEVVFFAGSDPFDHDVPNSGTVSEEASGIRELGRR